MKRYPYHKFPFIQNPAMKPLPKDKIHLTFGSEPQDDEYFIEWRTSSGDYYPFIVLGSTSDGKIEIHIGGSNNAVIMDLQEFESLLQESKTQMATAKEDFLKHKNDFE